MYCSKCGSALSSNQPACPACGHLAADSPVDEAAGFAEQFRFDRNIRRLSGYWLIFAALSFALGVVGFFMAPFAAATHSAPYEPWPHPFLWNWTMLPGVVWILLAARVVLALVAAWGLKERFNWSRPAAMLAGAVAITQFPIGLVLGAYTIAVLMGKHRAAMYAHRG